MALRRLQEQHISDRIIGQNDPVPRLLAVRRTNIEVTPHRILEPFLRAAGFWTIAQIGDYKLDNALISAVTERWRPETHTFHLPWGECTITLEDVALILGLRVDGKAVTGHSGDFVADGRVFGPADFVEYLLGVRPVGKELNGSALSMAFLHRHFTGLPDGVDEAGIVRFTRGYIMRLIGGLLIPNKTSSEVHICYLSLLVDLHTAGRYSWGAAVLAVLYRYLCKGTLPNSAQIGGCVVLLQIWAWYRMPFLRPGEPDILSPRFPLACRWTRVHVRHHSPVTMLHRYRELLDSMDIDSFLWLPYMQFGAIIPPGLRVGDPVWRSCTSLICFDIVEWHHADRVLRQFGYHQHIPQDPTMMDELHMVDMRGKQETKWQKYHRAWLRLWKSRRQRIAGEVPYGMHVSLHASREYYLWYWRETLDHLFLTGYRYLQLPNIDFPSLVYGSSYDVPRPPVLTGRRKRRSVDDYPSESDEDVPDEWPLRYAHLEQEEGPVDPHNQYHPPEPPIDHQSPYYPQHHSPLPLSTYYSSDLQFASSYPQTHPTHTATSSYGQTPAHEPEIDLDVIQFDFDTPPVTTGFDAWFHPQDNVRPSSPYFDRFGASMSAPSSAGPICRQLDSELDACVDEEVTLRLGPTGEGGRPVRNRRPPPDCPACPDT